MMRHLPLLTRSRPETAPEAVFVLEAMRWVHDDECD